MSERYPPIDDAQAGVALPDANVARVQPALLVQRLLGLLLQLEVALRVGEK